jgi:hypothetical protein
MTPSWGQQICFRQMRRLVPRGSVIKQETVTYECCTVIGVEDADASASRSPAAAGRRSANTGLRGTACRALCRGRCALSGD